MKTVKNIVKKAVKSYVINMGVAYKPCFEAGVNPTRVIM